MSGGPRRAAAFFLTHSSIKGRMAIAGAMQGYVEADYGRHHSIVEVNAPIWSATRRSFRGRWHFTHP
jgi:hypothetical protein